MAARIYKNATVQPASFQVRGVSAMEICAEFEPKKPPIQTEVPAGQQES